METLQIFLSKVNKTDSCWIWTRCVLRSGYGQTTHEGKRWYAHRLSFILHGKEIPMGKVLDHLCRNRTCVNPSHLEAVTQKVNIQRGVNVGKGAYRGGLRHGRLSAYTHFCCRCDLCKKAERIYREKNRERSNKNAVKRRRKKKLLLNIKS